MTTDSAGAEPIGESVRRAVDIAVDGDVPLVRSLDAPMLRATTAPTDSAFRVFRQLLDTDGLRYALYSVLRLTDYRFISVFAFDDGMIRSVAHVDREDLSVVETAPIPESTSYCCYVRSGDGPFAVVDSRVDARVEGHPKRQDLRAYCGVPITSADGVLLGTLCHYDLVPRDPGQLNADLLAQVADAIAALDAMAVRDR